MIANPFSLDGKTILVTGASSGIGRATAIACSQMMATVVLVARNQDRLADTLSLMSGIGHTIVNMDITSNAMEGIVKTLPKLDGVVHCAGIMKTCPAKFIQKDEVQEIFDTNVSSTIALMSLLLFNKKISAGASIVFVSSIAGGMLAKAGNAVYSASKGALTAYAKVLAVELAGRKIRVNIISAGMVRTDMMKSFSVDEEQFAQDEKQYLLGYGEAEDVANAIIYFLSDGSKWATGSNLVLDGGVTLQ